MKKNTPQIFETLIFGSANKLKEYYEGVNNKEQLDRLNEAIKSDRSMKELDANKFFYIFELMFETKNIQLVDEALRSIHDLIAQKFMNPSKDRILEQSLLRTLQKVLNRTPEMVANILVQIQSPTKQMLRLLFLVYPLCVFQATAQRIRLAGLSIISRIFSFNRKGIQIFTLKVFYLFRPALSVVPDQELTTVEEQQHLLKYYISKVLSEVVTKVELVLDPGTIQKGKFGLCFMCRAPAHFYCKDTKVSVCSPECKKTHLEELTKVTWLTSLHSEEEKNQIQAYFLEVLNDSTKGLNSRVLAATYLIEIVLSSSYLLKGQVRLIQQTSQNNYAELKKLTCLLLYLSAEQKGELIEHIFLNLLLFSQSASQYRTLCQAYFKEMFDSERIFEVYYNFDLNQARLNIIRDCLRILGQKDTGKLFVECLINNIFAHNNQLLDNSPYDWITHENEVVSLFNNSVQKGYELYVSNYKGENIERDLAYFLRKNQKALNREKLGQFFAKNEELNQKVLEIFLSMLNLNSLEIDEALREVFYHFSVGQSQQIFRVIEVFTKVYKNIKFESSDELFQFSYFILMLQTELHNPAIEKRMTFQDMVSRVSAFNKRLASDYEYLSSIYVNVKSKAFSQTQKRPRYRNFEIIKKAPLVPYSKSLLLYHNWSTLYSILSTDINFKKMELIYRTSLALIHYDVASIFLNLLINQLPKIDFLTRDLVEQETFLISSVLTLIWHQPNHVRKQWRNILLLLAQYQVLLDCLHAHKTQDLTQSHLQRNHQKLRLYLSETQINRLFHISKDFNDENFTNFCESLSTLLQSYFLPEVSTLFSLNITRIYSVWPFVCGYLNFQKEEFRIQPYLEILTQLHKFLKEPSLSSHKTSFLAMVDDILQWLSTDPKIDSLFVGTIFKLIVQTKGQINRQVWQLILKAFRQVQLQFKLEFSVNLQTLQNKELYEDFVTKEVIASGDSDFLKENIGLFKNKPELIEPHLKNFKNKQVLRCFILPIFCNFIINNLQLFPPSPELHQLLRNSIPTLTAQQLAQIHTYVIDQLKNIDAQIIQLTVMLLSTQISKKVIETVIKMIDMCQTQFPELDRSVKLGVEDKLVQLQTFKLNYNTIVKKTVLDLAIFKYIQENFTTFPEEISTTIAGLVNSAVKSSRAFNRNIALRYVLWKDGLLKDLKQLPGLIKKQRNTETLMLSILHREASTTQSWEKYVDYYTSLLSDLSNRFGEYLKHYKHYKSSHRDDLNYYYFNEIQRQVADYKKIISKNLNDLTTVDWGKVSKDIRQRLLKAIILTLKVGLFGTAGESFVFEIIPEDQILNQVSDKILETL